MVPMSTETDIPGTGIPIVAVLYLAFEPAWLALSRADRGVWAARVADIVTLHPGVSEEYERSAR